MKAAYGLRFWEGCGYRQDLKILTSTEAVAEVSLTVFRIANPTPRTTSKADLSPLEDLPCSLNDKSQRMKKKGLPTI